MLSLKSKHNSYLSYENPSLEREGYSWCSYSRPRNKSLWLYEVSLYSPTNPAKCPQYYSAGTKAGKTAMNSTKTTFLENRWKARRQDTLWYHTKRPSFCIAYIPQHNITPPLRWRAFASWRNVEESPSATQNKRSSSGRLW